jgi:hypothetical protein
MMTATILQFRRRHEPDPVAELIQTLRMALAAAREVTQVERAERFQQVLDAYHERTGRDGPADIKAFRRRAS